jgi:hypothetical protein
VRGLRIRLELGFTLGDLGAQLVGVAALFAIYHWTPVM